MLSICFHKWTYGYWVGDTDGSTNYYNYRQCTKCPLRQHLVAYHNGGGDLSCLTTSSKYETCRVPFEQCRLCSWKPY